jgi:hypothetical protein
MKAQAATEDATTEKSAARPRLILTLRTHFRNEQALMGIEPAISEEGDLEIMFAGGGTEESFSRCSLGVLIAAGRVHGYSAHCSSRPQQPGRVGPVTRLHAEEASYECRQHPRRTGGK